MDSVDIWTAVGIAKTIPTTAAGISVNAAEAAAASAAAAAESAASVTPSNADDVDWITDGQVSNTYAPQTDVISGSSVTIVAIENHRYVCGDEVSTLSITPAANGVTDVLFKSGSTPTVLTLPNTVELPEWFDATALETDTVYEISILDGVYCTIATWADE